jgi:hypothetical protein
LPLNEFEGLFFSQLLRAHQVALGPFHELPNCQCFLHLHGLLDQGRMLDGDGGMIGDGREQRHLIRLIALRALMLDIDHADHFFFGHDRYGDRGLMAVFLKVMKKLGS